MFVWNLAYDPIIYAIATASSTRCPTRVDDLNALTIGPGQTMAAALMVIACGFAAGLSADMHHCTRPGSLLPSLSM